MVRLIYELIRELINARTNLEKLIYFILVIFIILYGVVEYETT
jgi:hypothetical protein